MADASAPVRHYYSEMSNITHADLEAIINGIAPVIKEYVDKKTRIVGKEFGSEIVDTIKGHLDKYVHSRIDGMEKLIQELQINSMRYAGIFSRANIYRQGDTVTHSGGLWFCYTDTVGHAPGEAGAPWQLITKGGLTGSAEASVRVVGGGKR
jgi:hypothetical protein